MSSLSAPEALSERTMRIVHLISRDFRAVQDGGSVMTASLASALSAIGELHIIDMDRRPYDELGFLNGTLLPLPFGGEARFYSSVDHPIAESSPCSKWFVQLRRRFTRRSRKYRHKQALAITRRLTPDIVVADDLTGCLVAQQSGAGFRVVHTHNVESALHEKIATESGKGRFRRKARTYAFWEANVLPKVEQVWAVSETDGHHYRSLGTRDVRVMHIAFPNDRFETQPTTGKVGVGLFFGSLWYGPNIEAVRYLIKLAPRLREKLPNAVIRIVGGRASPELIAEMSVPGIEYLGFVKSLRSVAADAAAILVPLAWGGGTKIKTAEALALGKPVISTSEGVSGLDVEDGEQVWVRPLGETFDEAVLAALQSPSSCSELAYRGYQYAQSNFSQDALLANVRDALSVGPK